MSTSSTRVPCSPRTRKATRSRVVRSAQCRSSTTSTSGRSAPSRPSTPSTSSNSWAVLRRGRRRPARRRRARGAAGPVRGGPGPAAGRGRPAGCSAPASQCLDQRDERQALAAELDAAAGEHPDPGGGAERRLEQPALAHPGLAADEHDTGLAGPRPCDGGRQQRQLPFPSHEHRAHDLEGHARMLARRTPLLRCLSAGRRPDRTHAVAGQPAADLRGRAGRRAAVARSAAGRLSDTVGPAPAARTGSPEETT